MNQLGRLATPQDAPPTPAAVAVSDRLRRLFAGWAYIEGRFDVLLPVDGFSPEERRSMYTVAAETGDPLALRPDFTSLVAQEAATLGRGIARPLRRAYAGRAFRRPGAQQRREIHQAGVELIGTAGALADAEIVALASEGLESLGLRGAQIHLGHVGFIRALLRTSGLTEAAESEVCNLLARHDRAALADSLASSCVPADAADALSHLLDLAGSESVLNEARGLTDDPVAHGALDELETLAALLSQANLTTPVILDLTEVRDRSYYTGIRFEAFVPSSGFPVLRGGRYDHLLERYGAREPAVGCAFEIDRIAEVVTSDTGEDAKTALLRFPADRWGSALDEARTLRAQGRRVALDVGHLDGPALDAYRSAHHIVETIDWRYDSAFAPERGPS